MKTSETITYISKSLIAMQGNMAAVKKGNINPFFKSKYADLPSIWAAIREELQNNELCVVQDAQTLPDGVSVTTRLQHSSGEFMEFGPLIMPVSKNDAQAVGSALSYAKRYSLAASLGIVAEDDDDGNRAVKSIKKVPKNVCVQKEDFYKQFENDPRFSIEDVKVFVKAHSKHYKCSEDESIFELKKDQKKFENNLSQWLTKSSYSKQ